MEKFSKKEWLFHQRVRRTKRWESVSTLSVEI